MRPGHVVTGTDIAALNKVLDCAARQIRQTPAVHHAQEPVPMKDGYKYDATGEGVRDDLVQAVLSHWANCDPGGDPAGPLRMVNQGALNRVENLARMAALSVVQILEKEV